MCRGWMANFGERWAAARTRLPKAAPGFASVIRNSQVQKWRGPDALHVSDHGTPPDEATPDGTIPYRFNFLTQRHWAIGTLAPHLRQDDHRPSLSCEATE